MSIRGGAGPEEANVIAIIHDCEYEVPSSLSVANNQTDVQGGPSGQIAGLG